MAFSVGQDRADYLTFYFIKFFPEEAFAQQFLDGQMLFRPLSYFQRIEEHDGRGDRTEGVFAWLQPKGLRMELTVPTIGHTIITDRDLAAPVSMGLPDDAPHYIFSMYHVGASGLTPLGGTEFSCAADQREAIEAELRIDERCLQFGRHAVLVSVEPFIKRLKLVAKLKGWKIKTGLVEYYDDSTFNGQFAFTEAPFRKQKRFAHQREFRICVTAPTVGEPMRFEQLGSFRQFAQYSPAENLLDAFKLALRAA